MIRRRLAALVLATSFALAGLLSISSPAAASFWPNCPSGYSDLGVTQFQSTDTLFSRVKFVLVIYEHNCSNTFTEYTDFAYAAEACYLSSYPPCTPYPLDTLYLGDYPGANCAGGGCFNFYDITASGCTFNEQTYPSWSYSNASYAIFGPTSSYDGWLYSDCQHIPSAGFQAQFYKSGEFRYSVIDAFSNP